MRPCHACALTMLYQSLGGTSVLFPAILFSLTDGILSARTSVRRCHTPTLTSFKLSCSTSCFAQVCPNVVTFNLASDWVPEFCSPADESVVISAPTGSGKTVLFELAILRLLQAQRERCVCFAIVPCVELVVSVFPCYVM